MQDNVSLNTNEKDLDVKYGMYNLGPEREAARGSLKYILTDMNDIRKSFIRLGFHLSEMQNFKYYQDFGYLTLEEFAEANLGMDKSNVYRYIRVYEQFAAENGSMTHTRTFYLDDKWKDYSFSQLVEMCSMSDIQRRACNPEMTIKQIREVKKTVCKDISIVNGQQEHEPVVKVATSPLIDKSKDFSYDYCMGLHGAAKSSYVKSRVSVGSAEIYIYDSDGKRLRLEPSILNLSMDLLYCKNSKYVFRLNQPVEHWQPEQES